MATGIKLLNNIKDLFHVKTRVLSMNDLVIGLLQYSAIYIVVITDHL